VYFLAACIIMVCIMVVLMSKKSRKDVKRNPNKRDGLDPQTVEKLLKLQKKTKKRLNKSVRRRNND
jgi:hypothetical protein